MKRIYLLLLLAAATLAGCAKDDTGRNDSRTPITLEAGVGSATLMRAGASSEGLSRAGDGPIRGGAGATPALTLFFARADQDPAMGVYGDYAATAIGASRAASAGNAATAVVWAAGQEQYYLSNGKKTKLTGWYPGGAAAAGDADGKGYYDGTARTVSWKIDGTQDVMTAAKKEGSKVYGDAIGNLAFEHRLSQVQVYIYAENAAAQTLWGAIRGVTLRNQRAECSYDLTADANDGSVTFSGAADTPFEVYADVAGDPVPVGKSNALLLGASMIEPQAAGYALEMEVVTELGELQEALLAPQAYGVSTAYAIYLKLAVSGITLDRTTIVPWSAGDDAGGDVEIPVAYPYVEGGKIIVSEDKYGSSGAPLHPDWEQTPDHNETAAEINRVGVKFEVAQDDIAPAAWGSTNGDCTAPWRRPTIEELKTIYRLRDQLTGISAFATDSPYWAGTEFSSDPDNAWFLAFGDNGRDYGSAKSGNGYTRCVQDVDYVPSTLEVDENGILVLKKGTERGRMLFFQFGSVVGFTQGTTNNEPWPANGSAVLFNPVTGSPSYATYTDIPIYTSADYSAGRTNVSAPAYHNGANVKAGKGDPCKLVGLSARQIQGMSAAELDAYESGWRLPTKEEVCSFTGQTANGSYSAHWTASDARYDNWYYSTGSTGGYFPKGQEAQQKNYLPAAGDRNTDGSTNGVGVSAYYWSSTAYSNVYGYYLYFGSSDVHPLNNYYYAHGFGARCVKEPELAVDENGILVLSGNGTKKMLFFQFGSVVGFTQEGAWAADEVLFNPVTGSPSYATYSSIPNAKDAGLNDGDQVSAAAYHNGANVKAGKGDLCKLVGLSAKDIQNMTASELDAYESGWRLPTKEELCSVTGQTANGGYTAHWIASDARYDNWYYSTGSAGGYFPKGQEVQQKNYLPAAGLRDASSSTANVGSDGYYWSSTANSNTGGYHLYFSSTSVGPLAYSDDDNGIGARCVRTTP